MEYKHSRKFIEKKAALLKELKKVCIKCGVEKDKSLFTNDKRHADGKYPICHDCAKTIARKLYLRQPEVIYATNKRWAKRNPEKIKAHSVLNDAVRRKKISKPKQCQECGSKGRIEAHHHLGYEKEHWLDVQWLCRLCHEKADKKSVIIA